VLKQTIPQLGNVCQEKIPPVQWPDLDGEMKNHPNEQVQRKRIDGKIIFKKNYVWIFHEVIRCT